MKQFRIQPLMNLAAKNLPREVELTMPAGCTVRVNQYYNYVWFMIEEPKDMKTRVKRNAVIVTEGESVPNDYEYVGYIIGNLLGDSPLLDEEGNQITEEDEDEEAIIDSPETEEEFYASFFPLCVYIAPEKSSRLNDKSWSYLGEKS
jgi:hypothetical protein